MVRLANKLKPLLKARTGIDGLDEITEGGLPAGRPTLIAGNAGCGKTLFAMEFLVNGINEYGEPGVFVSFEETKDDLIQNVASLGDDLKSLINDKKLYIDHVQVERSEIEETGEYDLEGLFIRLGYAIDSIGAKRVVLDTLESLFSGFENDAILRAELRRLFMWLKDRGVTAIITGERGDASITRQGMEEYVSDCVILLDHRIEDQISTRRLRIVKYRGSTHGTNEYPFLIDKDGITVIPITSMTLDHDVSTKRISSGIAELDTMLAGGYYQGSSILLSGTAGTGKTNVATYLADAACRRGEPVLYIAFEESPQQIVRNGASIGLNLQTHIKNGLLYFESQRSSSQGLEMLLAVVFKLVRKINPSVVIIDPITNLITAGNNSAVQSTLGRLLDMLKSNGATVLLTSLTQSGAALEQTEFGISSFADTWLLLRDFENNGERNRLIYVLKSRGTAHSNQVREFIITNEGIRLAEVYLGENGVLTGSARVNAEAQAKATDIERQNNEELKKRHLEHKRQITEAKLKSDQAELDMQTAEINSLVLNENERQKQVSFEAAMLAYSRSGKHGSNAGSKGNK
jgi:circadian clock protein KaiC